MGADLSSGTEAIAGEIARIIEAINRARTEAGGAAEHAGQIASRAAGSGFVAIAGQLDGIRKQISATDAMLASASDSATQAGATVRAVGDRTTPEQVRERLTEATGHLDTMRASLVTAIERLHAIHGQVAAALHGGQPGPLLQRLDMIRQLAQIAGQHSTATRARIQAELSQVGQLGSSGSSGPAGPAPSAPPATRPSRTDSHAPVTPAVRAAAQSLPRRTGLRDKTEGFLLADDVVVHDRDVSAEPDGRLRSRHLRTGNLPLAGAGLLLPTARAFSMDHVEAHAAAVLRRPGAPRSAVLVVNQAPCDSQTRPLVCEKILGDMLL